MQPASSAALSCRPKTSPEISTIAREDTPLDRQPAPRATRPRRSMSKRAFSQFFPGHSHDRHPSLAIGESSTTYLADGDGIAPHATPQEGRMGFRKILRRSSVGGSSIQHLYKSLKGNNELDMEELQSPAPSTPSTTSKPPTFLSKFTNLRRRRPATSGPSGIEGRWIPVPPTLPAGYLEPPVIPYDPSKGQAARDSANLARRNRQEAHLGRSADTLADWDSSIDVSDDGMEEVTEDLDTPFRRTDPFARLPQELCDLILINLDARTLSRAERVSKPWRKHASQPEVWRHVYLRAYMPKVYNSPAPVQMGGLGLGRMQPSGAIQPAQDWKNMYRIRKIIERRWIGGNPGAIYFQGHTDSVYCCQFDEDKIITGSRDRTIRVWDIKTYECLRVIGGPAARPVLPTQPPHPTQPNYTVCAGQNLNGTARGNAIYYEPQDYHSASILCLQYDGDMMVTGSSDTTCIVWDMKTWEPLYRLRHHTGGVLDVCLDAKHIISCSKDATICVWERSTGTLLKVLRGHRGPVNAVQLRGNLLVSASGDGVAKLWNLDLPENNCIREFQSQDRGLAAVEFSDDRRWVLAGGNDQVVYKFDANTGALVHRYEGHTGLVRSLFLDAFNGRVVSGSYDQSMRVYDHESGDLIATYRDWTTSWILSAKADYRRIVCTSQDGRAVLLDFGYGIPGVECLESR